MKHIRLKLVAINLFGLALTGVFAQNINVKVTNGTQTAFPINTVKKLCFTSSSIAVYKTSGNVSGYAYSNVRNLNFDNIKSVSISSLKNSKIFSLPQSVNTLSNDYPLMIAMTWTWSGVTGIQRTLLQFDLSQIPKNAIIQSATLSLKGSGSNPHTHSNSSSLNLITQPWDYSNTTWTNMNNKYTTTGKIPITGTTTGVPNENKTVDLKSMVQYWVNNPQLNYGMMFKLDNETTYATMQFGTDDNTNSTLRPILDIIYAISSQKSAVSTIFDGEVAANPINLVTSEEIVSDSTFLGNNIIISPIPAYTYLDITINVNGIENVDYEIYDLIGTKEAFGQISANRKETIVIESLNHGVYFIKFKYKNEVISKKFIVKE